MDRTLFGQFGAGLNDDDFACALAAYMVLVESRGPAPPELLGLDEDDILHALRRGLDPELAKNPKPKKLIDLSLAWADPQYWPSPPRLNWSDFARAWRRLLEEKGGRLALRVGPVYWSPNRYRDLIIAILGILARPVVEAASVVHVRSLLGDGASDWPLPITVSAASGDLLPKFEVAEHYPLRTHLADRDHPRSSILVIAKPLSQAVAELVSSPFDFRACIVLVVGPVTETPAQILAGIQSLSAHANAEGVAIVDADAMRPDELRERVKNLGYNLSHNHRIDGALQLVFGENLLFFATPRLLDIAQVDSQIDELLPRLSTVKNAEFTLSGTTKSRIERRATLPGGAVTASAVANAINASRVDFAFDSETHEASAMTEIIAAVAAAEAETLPNDRRFLRRALSERDPWVGIDDRGYVAGADAVEMIDIGPLETGFAAAAESLPEPSPSNRRTRKLQIVFSEPAQLDGPLRQTIELPPTGASTSARFAFKPKQAGKFEARVSVLYRGRILQTAKLRTQVYASPSERAEKGEGVKWKEESELHNLSDLGSRRAFDLSIIANAGDDGKHSATLIGKSHAIAKSLDGIDKPVTRINELLSHVANSPEDYTGAISKGQPLELLVGLAVQGRKLYDELYRRKFEATSEGGFDDTLEYIQIISANANAIVPIEFMYGRATPPPDARMCPKHAVALKEGKCPVDCPGMKTPEKHVCPMGFWGLSKVIERHSVDENMIDLPKNAQVLLQSEPRRKRDRISLGAGAVLGFSERVKAGDAKPVVTLLGKLTKNRAKGVKNWGEWKAAVAAAKPTLLISCPHNTEDDDWDFLEIGDELLSTVGLDGDYARAAGGPPTIVMLLGCSSAATASQFATPVGGFRLAGASVVIGTVATVFGEHAPKVAALLASSAFALAANKPISLGEVMRDVRRQALLGKLPMALCVTAFGDADWLLEA